jgi:acyl homoserine lactone synthase
MIRYLYAEQLAQHPHLKSTMLKDRATQFHTRLKWEVSVDDDGFEQDQYDRLNPLYVIWQNADGSHGGSMRFLPTTGDTMVNDHFAHLVGGGAICAPKIWETTRFCISPDAADGSRIAALLMMAGGQLGVSFGLSHSIGVFDARMVRIYRKLGWEPEILGTDGEGREAISAGLWEFSPEILEKMARKAGVSTELSQLWFERAFGTDTLRIAA